MDKIKCSLCTYYKEARDNFSLDEMAYSLIFGLAPTAWDIISDIKLGLDLERDGDVQESGLCLFIITNPGIVILWDKAWKHIAPNRPELVLILLFNLILVLAILFPFIFKYSAIIVSIFIILGKTIAVFVHTSEMKLFSQYLSEHECIYESPLQLIMLLHIWLSTGKMYLFTMVSSVLIIGKVSAENYLMKGRENKLENKTFFIFLIGQYIPVMSLTAVFRLGSTILFLFPPSLFQPISFIASLIMLDLFYCLPYQLLCMLGMHILKPWCPNLRRLSGFEIFQALTGELITITTWPKGGQPLQVNNATGTIVFNRTTQY